ncbi:T9SS type A sorting domain-containing protein [Flavobacterium sp. CYK-4]|nr:aryl-sulfate sulfotransferase [Flavobacterium lotistagni]NHM06908.1 T9SS type A sorting domain-containing protein [Flavobacterium lotistagni]
MKKITAIAFLCALSMQSQTVGLLTHETGTLDDGYVLFAPNTSNTTYLIDKCGRLVKSWNSSYKPGQAVYLLEDGHLLRTGNANNNTFNAGGKGGIIEKIDWNGNVIWSYSISDTNQCQHHDAKALPNGNILVISWEKITNTSAIALGRNPALVPSVLWSEKIIEIQPVGSNSANIVWEWHLTDHLVQDFDASKPNYNSVASNPQLLNINYGASATNSDWIHLNSIDYNPELDQILLSSHNLDEIWIIDHSTTTVQAATHNGGNSGKGGDFLYRWGNPATYNQTEPAQFFGQHNAQWIKSGLPFENQIMVFNNGLARPGGNYSTVEIIDPPVNGYQYDSTIPYLPSAPTWTYNQGNPNDYYAMNISGTQMLANGNVLLCNGPAGIFTEVDPMGNLLWKYVNPVNVSGVILQNNTPTQNSVFRCSFYPSNFAGFAEHQMNSGAILENQNTVSDLCNLTLTSNAFSVNDYRIYPNPAADFVVLQMPTTHEDFKVDLIDITGKIIQSKVMTQGTTIGLVETDGVRNGMYFIRINDKTFKVIVNK